jgi:hypothetical protein
MPACHAGGRGFESRPFRIKPQQNAGAFLLAFFDFFYLEVDIHYTENNLILEFGHIKQTAGPSSGYSYYFYLCQSQKNQLCC